MKMSGAQQVGNIFPDMKSGALYRAPDEVKVKLPGGDQTAKPYRSFRVLTNISAGV